MLLGDLGGDLVDGSLRLVDGGDENARLLNLRRELGNLLGSLRLGVLGSLPGGVERLQAVYVQVLDSLRGGGGVDLLDDGQRLVGGGARLGGGRLRRHELRLERAEVGLGVDGGHLRLRQRRLRGGELRLELGDELGVAVVHRLLEFLLERVHRGLRLLDRGDGLLGGGDLRLELGHHRLGGDGGVLRVEVRRLRLLCGVGGLGDDVALLDLGDVDCAVVTAAAAEATVAVNASSWA